jgi:hypothetical protein
MLRVLSGAVVLLAVLSPSGGTKKQPWLWSPDERINERFSPESIEARKQLATSHTRTVPPTMSPINGDTHAELFFPWELMDRLLRMQTVTPSGLRWTREPYRKHIETAGWDYDAFWSELEANAIDYLILFRELQQHQRPANTANAQRTDRERITSQICAARAAALNAMRQTYGDVAFDRFLYSAMAPGFHGWIDNKEYNAEKLMRVQGGCK